MTAADYERNIGIEPLDVLHAQRREYAEEFAELEAFRQQYNDKRKAYLAVRSLQIRDGALASGAKVTEKLIEDMAHGDEQYLAWLDTATTQLARREILKAEIEMIDQIVMRGQAIARAYTAEARLA